jgi:uncharacterized damage-inducible protein DinB
MIDEIVRCFSLNLSQLRRLVTDLDADQMVAQVGGVVNHPAWTIGHIVHSIELIGGEAGLPPWLPATWAESFTRGTTPVAERESYPDKAALLAALDDAEGRIVQRLRTMSAVDLAAPLPDARFHALYPTVAHALLQVLVAHPAHHSGQLIAWRRAMRLPMASGGLPGPVNSSAG